MAGGEHPANPFPQPENWIELERRLWWPRADIEPLILYPYFRRRWFRTMGDRSSTPLASLASIPAFVPDADPVKGAQQALRISSMMNARGSLPPLRIQIADGATTLDPLRGDQELQLEAYRQLALPSVSVQLFWPKVTFKIDWFLTMIHGSTLEIEEAFRTGKTPPR